MPRPLWPSATLLAVAALAAGCGGDDEDEPGRTVRAAPGGVVEIVGTEYRFDPENVVMSGPGRLTIRLANRGALAHDVRVLQGERDVGGTPTFQGGRTRGSTVALRRGTYELICSVGNHAELGMRGSLKVE